MALTSISKVNEMPCHELSQNYTIHMHTIVCGMDGQQGPVI